jgi:NADH-quinone oxidoreductase subunit C
MSDEKRRTDQQQDTPGAAASVPPVVEHPAITQPENLPTPPHTEGTTVDVRHGMFGVRGTGDTSGYSGLVREVHMPASTRPPYGGWFDETADNLRRALVPLGLSWYQAVEAVVVDRGELTFHIVPERIVGVCQALRDDPDLRYELLSSLSGVHYPQQTGRELHTVYHLTSITHNRRIRLECSVPDENPHLPSVFSVYPTCDWQERETFDFFGIIYDGHPALTRIEMPDDWPGHPQRKDYPLGGIPVEYKGAQIPPPDERRSYN